MTLPTGHDYLSAARVLATDPTEIAALVIELITIERGTYGAGREAFQRAIMRLSDLGRVQEMLDERKPNG